MHFNLSEERKMLKESCDRLLNDHYTQYKNHHEVSSSETGFNKKFWEECSEIGMLSALISPNFNGLGGTGEDIMIVFELIGKHLVVEPFLSSGILSITSLTNSKDIETSVLDEISSASKIYAFGHSEVDTRYDETYIKTKANYKNDAVFLTGQKSFVLNGDFADKIICTARFSGNDFDQNGFGLYEIDKTHCDIRSYNTIDGYRAAELKFSETPAKELCKNSDAYNALLETLYAGAFALSAESIGAMQVCFNMTLEYLKTREQFGKPIGSFQALQHRMVDVMIEIEQAKSAVMLAAGTYEADKNTKYKNISAAKNLVGRAGKLVAEECIQLHGGIAMTWEYNLHNYAKRLVMIDHLMGDSDHHLEKFKLYSNY